MTLLGTTPLTSLKLLVAVFRAIIEETKDMKIKETLPSVDTYNEASNYVEDNLSLLLKENPKNRIFIFIDEFEELLLNRNALKSVVSGIKELINGQYGPIHEKGLYEGAIHFFISCTPEAYFKLQIHEETSEIFGGLGRRTKVIELPEISKKEGITFLYELLRYSYNGELPDPLPVINLGVFNLLLKISQNNLGVLTSLFTNVLNSVRENDYLQVLDYDPLLSFLEKEQIFVYGGQTQCIERAAYFRILKLLKDQRDKNFGELCGSLFELTVGELKPFNIDELISRTGQSKRQIQSAINTINENIKSKEKIEKAIIKLAPLRGNKNLEDILEFFDEYIEIDRIKDEKVIRIEGYSEYLSEFIDKIMFYYLDDGDVISRIFLPINDSDIKALFNEQISQEKAIELQNALHRLRNDEVYYFICESILTQLFPTPAPKGLEFIIERELRLKLWRDVSRDLFGFYEKYMPQSFLRILEESDLYEFIEEKNDSNFSIIQLNDKKADTTLRSLFYAINGDVKGQDIEKISGILNTNRNVHLTVLLYTGEITPKAQEKIKNKELGKEDRFLLLDVRLHPTLTKKILCMHRTLIEFNEEVFDVKRIKALCREIVTQELMFDTRVLDWLKQQEKKGLVISQIATSARSLKEFSDALKFYINYIDEAASPEEIFNRNMAEILKFRKYGSKTGLLPSDIDSAQKIEELSKDLDENGFLDKKNGVYKVIDSPVEKKICQIIEKTKKITVSELREYFIIKEKMKKVLEDVYVNILDYKGRIKREKNYYELIDCTEFFKIVKEKYERYKESTKQDEFKTFGHFYVVKQKEDNLIMIKKFDNFIIKLFDNIEYLMPSSKEEAILQKISLAKRLIDQFTKEVVPAVKGAFTKGKDIMKNAKEKKDIIEEELLYITDNGRKWLKFEFSLENIDEYKTVSRIYENLLETSKKTFSYEELEEIKKTLSDEEKNEFMFNKDITTSHYFNIKLFKLDQLKIKLDSKIKEITRFIERIKPYFENINERERDFRDKLKIKVIPEKYRISLSVLSALKSYQTISEDIDVQDYRDSGIKLRNIEKATKEISKEITKKIDRIANVMDASDKLLIKERDFLSELSRGKEMKEKVRTLFDTDEYHNEIEKFENEISQIEKEYGKIAKDVEKEKFNIAENLTELEKLLDHWNLSIDKAENILKDEWTVYREKSIKFTRRVEEILNLLSKKHEIEFDEIEKRVEEFLKRIELSLEKALDDKISLLEIIKKEIEDLASKITDKYISSNEKKVLDVFYAKKDEKQKWITYEELVNEIMEKYGIPENDVDTAIDKLISKKYILSGLSLSL